MIRKGLSATLTRSDAARIEDSVLSADLDSKSVEEQGRMFTQKRSIASSIQDKYSCFVLLELKLCLDVQRKTSRLSSIVPKFSLL